jgi:hypothetical protein
MRTELKSNNKSLDEMFSLDAEKMVARVLRDQQLKKCQKIFWEIKLGPEEDCSKI